jgi:four helix bundle protein
LGDEEPRTKNLEPKEANVAEYSYRNLILWNKAQELTLDVIRLIAPLRRSAAADVIAKQIIRSSSSIAANVAEGHGRFTPGAHSFHLSVAKGSACETDSWLDLLRRSELINAEQEKPLHDTCMELVAMLTSKIRQLEVASANSKRSGSPSSRIGDERAEYIVDATLQYPRGLDSNAEVLGS